MALARPSQWARFERSNVDLSDVVGTPGLPGSEELAERLSAAFDGATARAAPVSGVFVSGAFPVRLAGSPENSVRTFAARMQSRVAPLGFSPQHVVLRGVTQSATGTHIRAQQTLRGTGVVGSDFRLHLHEDGTLHGLSGRPLGDLLRRDPAAPPKTSEEDALAAIRAEFGLDRSVKVGVRRVVFPLHGTAVWAWEGHFVLDHPPTDVRAFVRADDLSLLLSYNIASAHMARGSSRDVRRKADAPAPPEQSPLAALRGEGRVYPVNPLRTPELKPVRLSDISPGPTCALRGQIVAVAPRSGEPLASPSRDYRLEADAAGFDEVQAYYHLWRAIRYFEGLVDPRYLTQPPFGPIRAWVNDPGSPNNAYYVPDANELTFGDFDFGAKPSARSADIVYHELGHAVTDAICKLARAPEHTSPRALSEGYSDYFAASALDDPVLLDYVAPDPIYVRDCSKKGLTFATAPADEHAQGEVWASVLWSIRSSLGAEIADLLAAESLHWVDNAATFEAAHQALLHADRSLFPHGADHSRGRHEETIEEAFSLRARPGPAD